MPYLVEIVAEVKALGLETCMTLGMLVTLANLKKPPESVPINQLVRVRGTPLEHGDDLDLFAFIRMIATTRIMMPKSVVRIAAGREFMTEQTQALCFMAGANSVFYGRKLLTAKNVDAQSDMALFTKLVLNPQ